MIIHIKLFLLCFFSSVACADPAINDGGVADRAGDSRIIITRTADDSVVGNGHAFSDQTTVNRRSGIGYASFDARANFLGGSYNHYVAYQAAGGPTISGTMNNLYDFYSASGVNTGSVGNLYGLYKANAPNSGYINTQYGIYIEDLSSGENNQGIRLGVSAGSYKYNIYADGTAPSYFNHALMLGNTDRTSCSWANGGYLFVSGGALKFCGGNGTITTVAKP